MGRESNFILLSLLTTLTAAAFLTLTSSSSDYKTLVFKGCADRDFQDFNPQTIQHLLDTLTTQSSVAKFHNATSDGGVDGLFQCRGDLSSGDCQSCVEKASSMAQKLCKKSLAARIQLNGCYLGYQISGFRQAGRTDLLFKVCGSGSNQLGPGFGDRLDSALGGIVKGMESGNNNGFYAGGYESIYVLGQCEGDLSGAECVECVKNGVGRAKSECGTSFSGHLYFQQCYISYTYYPNGVKSNDQKSLSSSSSSSGMNTQKTVAIVMGGLVGLGLVMSCLLYTKSAFKKKVKTYNHHTTNYKHGGAMVAM